MIALKDINAIGLNMKDIPIGAVSLKDLLIVDYEPPQIGILSIKYD